MNNRRKKSRDKKLKKTLSMNRGLLLEELKKEWSEAESYVKRLEKYQRFVDNSKMIGSAVAKSILVLAAIGGVLTIAVVAPNVFVAFDKMRKRHSFYDKKELQKSISHLSHYKFIKVSRNSDSCDIKITEEGIGRALAISYKNLKVRKIKKWDSIWRMVIFDIPNRYKWAGECFRHKLKEMDFYPLQKSVFVIPHPCYDQVISLVSIFNINDYVNFIETSRISNDFDLRKHFEL